MFTFCRQESAIFPSHVLATWEEPFRDSLYIALYMSQAASSDRRIKRFIRFVVMKNTRAWRIWDVLSGKRTSERVFNKQCLLYLTMSPQRTDSSMHVYIASHNWPNSITNAACARALTIRTADIPPLLLSKKERAKTRSRFHDARMRRVRGEYFGMVAVGLQERGTYRLTQKECPLFEFPSLLTTH